MAIEMSIGISIKCTECGVYMPVHSYPEGTFWTEHPIRPFECINNGMAWDIQKFNDIPEGYETIKQRID